MALLLLWEICDLFIGNYFVLFNIEMDPSSKFSEPSRPIIAYYISESIAPDGSPMFTFTDGDLYYRLLDHDAQRKFKHMDAQIGTPFAIRDPQPLADGLDIERIFTSFALPNRDEDKLAPVLRYNVEPTRLGRDKRVSYQLTYYGEKFSFSLIFPTFTFPKYLASAEYTLLSFKWKRVAHPTRQPRIYPRVNEATMQVANRDGTPKFSSSATLTQSTIKALALAHDAKLICGGFMADDEPAETKASFLHLSDQDLASNNVGSTTTLPKLVEILSSKYESKPAMMRKIEKYFASCPAGSFAEAASESRSKTKVILIPDLNKDFPTFTAEDFASSLLDSGHIAPWIITFALPSTTTENFARLNSSKLNPTNTSEIILHTPTIKVFSRGGSSTEVFLLAYKRGKGEAARSLLMPNSIVPLPDISPPDTAYDTNPDDRWIVDFAATARTIDRYEVLDKVARTGKFYFALDNRGPRTSRMYRYVADFATQASMQAFISFCNARPNLFCLPRKKLSHGTPAIIRSYRGLNDPNEHLNAIRRLFGVQNCDLFPISNLSTAVLLPDALADALPAILSEMNSKLRSTEYIACLVGDEPTDLSPRRRLQSSRRSNSSSDSDAPHVAPVWYEIKGKADFDNPFIFRMCQQYGFSAPCRAWSSTGRTAIVFQRPQDPDNPDFVDGEAPPRQVFTHSGQSVEVLRCDIGEMDRVTPISHSAAELSEIFGASGLRDDSGDELDDVGDKLRDAINQVRATFNMDVPICDDAFSAGADEARDVPMNDDTQSDHARAKSANWDELDENLGFENKSTSAHHAIDQATTSEETGKQQLQPDQFETEGTSSQDELYDDEDSDEPQGNSQTQPGDEARTNLPEKQGPSKKVKAADGSWTIAKPKKAKKKKASKQQSSGAPPGPPGVGSTKPKEPDKPL